MTGFTALHPRRSFPALVVAAAGAMLLGACTATVRSGSAPEAGAAAAAAAPKDESALLGRDWVFVRVEGFDGPLPSPPPIAGFILTREGENRLTGTTACNRLGAGFELDAEAGQLRFVDLRNTRMMCDRIAADTEYAVLQAMIATDSYRIVGEELELWGGGRRLAVLAAADPVPPDGRQP